MMNKIETISLEKFEKFVKSYNGETTSQLNQELLILFLTNYKTNGYFVEFGACNGKHISNTYFLEKDYNWSGIVSEPARIYYKELKKNRNCSIDNRAVYKKSGDVVEFREVSGVEEVSGIDETLQTDSFKNVRRKRGTIYQIKTISLDDLLKEHGAPKNIDYLSIDTEGSEYDILSNFSFSTTFNVITVEHNYINESRNKLKELLESKGYIRIFEKISRWDDWYIHTNFLEEIK